MTCYGGLAPRLGVSSGGDERLAEAVLLVHDQDAFTDGGGE
jgi:hypothetical protein